MESLLQSQMVPILLIGAIFYFLILKPQQKKQKEQKSLLENLSKNQQVVTAGGIHGKIVAVKEKTVVIRVDENVKIEFDKESVSSVINKK